jgi:hypothetical protein
LNSQFAHGPPKQLPGINAGNHAFNADLDELFMAAMANDFAGLSGDAFAVVTGSSVVSHNEN